MPKSWQTLEENVRELASAVWQGPCLPAQVGGVDIDGVISAADDMKILIEITERDKLPKVREDIQKTDNCSFSNLHERRNAFSLLLCDRRHHHKCNEGSG